MSRFKEHLWRELVREHGADLARLSRPPSRGRRPRPRLLAGTTAGLAGVGTAVALLLGVASSSPAFAVTQSHDGTVSVVIRQMNAVQLVNARLAKLGLRARFVPVLAGCAPPAVMRILPPRLVRPGSVKVIRGSVIARFDPRKIPAGQVLVVPAWGEGAAITAALGPAVLDVAPRCLPPALPLPGNRIEQAPVGGGPVLACTITPAIPPALTTPAGKAPPPRGAAAKPVPAGALPCPMPCPASARARTQAKALTAARRAKTQTR